MKYDMMHLPGVVPPGCGAVTISPDLDDDHERGDRIRIKCDRCGRYGEHEILGALRGLAGGKCPA